MKESRSVKLFIVSIIILALTFLIATFWDSLGLGENKIPLAMAVTIIFGISIAGVIMWFNERKQGKKTFLIGLLGNVMIIVSFIAIIIIAGYTNY